MYLLSFCKILAVAFILTRVSAQEEPTAPPAPPEGPTVSEWFGGGGNIYSNRWNYENTLMSSTALIDEGLQLNCKESFPNGLSVAPAVLGNIAYFPTWNGSYYAYNYVTCSVVWQINVEQLIYNFATPNPVAVKIGSAASRTAPTIDPNNGILYFATQLNALLVAVNINTGAVLATVQVNSHPMAVCTNSPTWFDGAIFIGSSSLEEYASIEPGYECCSFIGNFKAYVFANGVFTELWEFTSLPAGTGWSGGGMWGGNQPSIDPGLQQVFVGTGDAYTFPQEYYDCIAEGESCLPAGVYIDSIVALSIGTGEVNWHYAVEGLDSWVYACDVGPDSNCEDDYSSGPDADFGMAPMFLPGSVNPTGMDLIISGQKSGNIYCFTNTGYHLWTTFVGSGTTAEFLVWGLASDAAHVYFTLYNEFGKTVTSGITGQTFQNSAWGALDIAHGGYVWETIVPENRFADAPPIIANDMVWVASPSNGTSTEYGEVHALNRNTGAIIYTLPTEGILNGGVMVTGGYLMFGTGSSKDDSLYTFAVYGLPSATEASKAAL